MCPLSCLNECCEAEANHGSGERLAVVVALVASEIEDESGREDNNGALDIRKDGYRQDGRNGFLYGLDTRWDIP